MKTLLTTISAALAALLIASTVFAAELTKEEIDNIVKKAGEDAYVLEVDQKKDVSERPGLNRGELSSIMENADTQGVRAVKSEKSPLRVCWEVDHNCSQDSVVDDQGDCWRINETCLQDSVVDVEYVVGVEDELPNSSAKSEGLPLTEALPPVYYQRSVFAPIVRPFGGGYKVNEKHSFLYDVDRHRDPIKIIMNKKRPAPLPYFNDMGEDDIDKTMAQNDHFLRCDVEMALSGVFPWAKESKTVFFETDSLAHLNESVDSYAMDQNNGNLKYQGHRAECRIMDKHGVFTGAVVGVKGRQGADFKKNRKTELIDHDAMTVKKKIAVMVVGTILRAGCVGIGDATPFWDLLEKPFKKDWRKRYEQDTTRSKNDYRFDYNGFAGDRNKGGEVVFSEGTP